MKEREGGRQGETDRDRGSGGVQGRFLPVVSHCRKAKLLPDLGIHPCSYTSRLLVSLSLSFHSSFSTFSFFFVFSLRSSSLSSFWLLWRSVLLGGVAQGDDVRGEAVFEQDASVSLAIQLSYETVPVDHEARTKPAEQDKRNKAGLFVSTSSLSSHRVLK